MLPSGATIDGNIITTAPDVADFLPSSGGTAGTTTFSGIVPQTTGSLKQTVFTTVATNTDGYQDSQKTIAVGQDGFVRFVYKDITDTEIHFVQCLDADCASRGSKGGGPLMTLPHRLAARREASWAETRF
jgi:hypothetical protein